MNPTTNYFLLFNQTEVQLKLANICDSIDQMNANWKEILARTRLTNHPNESKIEGNNCQKKTSSRMAKTAMPN